MDNVIKRIVDNNLADFKGLSIEGEIPVSEEILNDMIGLFMKSGKSDHAPVNEPASDVQVGTDKPAPDFKRILDSLDEKDVKVHFHEKQAVIKLVARKY